MWWLTVFFSAEPTGKHVKGVYMFTSRSELEEEVVKVIRSGKYTSFYVSAA